MGYSASLVAAVVHLSRTHALSPCLLWYCSHVSFLFRLWDLLRPPCLFFSLIIPHIRLMHWCGIPWYALQFNIEMTISQESFGLMYYVFLIQDAFQ